MTTPQMLQLIQMMQMNQQMQGLLGPMPEQSPMMGLLGKAAGDRPGYLAPITGKPVKGDGGKFPTQRTLAVRG